MPDSTTAADDASKRRLRYRFCTLPFRQQLAVLLELDVMVDSDDHGVLDELFDIVFARAARAGRVDPTIPCARMATLATFQFNKPASGPPKLWDRGPIEFQFVAMGGSGV